MATKNLKRSRDIEDSEDFASPQYEDPSAPQPPNKKLKNGGGRAKASEDEKAARKAARMARNRDAAQASRDRRKQYITELEGKVKSLESLLASTNADTALSPLDFLEESRTLKEENESLKSRLDIMIHESMDLKRRLQAFESKYSSSINTTPSLSPSSPHSSSSSSSSVPEFNYPLFPSHSVRSSPEKDGSRLVAREVKISLQRKPSSMDWTSPFHHMTHKPMLSDLRSSVSKLDQEDREDNFGLPSPESVKDLNLGEPPGTAVIRA